jgi:hypothetical protein
MTDKEFYDLCYDQYKFTFSQTDALYHRMGLLLTPQVVLGGVMVALGRPDLVAHVFERVDVFLYHLSMVAAFTSLFVSVGLLFRVAFPRQYQGLATMEEWMEWRSKCVSS